MYIYIYIGNLNIIGYLTVRRQYYILQTLFISVLGTSHLYLSCGI